MKEKQNKTATKKFAFYYQEVRRKMMSKSMPMK